MRRGYTSQPGHRSMSGCTASSAGFRTCAETCEYCNEIAKWTVEPSENNCKWLPLLVPHQRTYNKPVNDPHEQSTVGPCFVMKNSVLVGCGGCPKRKSGSAPSLTRSRDRLDPGFCKIYRVVDLMRIWGFREQLDGGDGGLDPESHTVMDNVPKLYKLSGCMEPQSRALHLHEADNETLEQKKMRAISKQT